MKTDPISSNQPLRSFILRLLVDAHGELRGQISEPGSEDACGVEWRITFVGMQQLWANLLGRFESSTIQQTPSQREPHNEDDHA